MRGPRGRDDPRRVNDAIMLFTLERTLDAVADGETTALGLGVTPVVTAAPRPGARSPGTTGSAARPRVRHRCRTGELG